MQHFFHKDHFPEKMKNIVINWINPKIPKNKHATFVVSFFSKLGEKKMYNFGRQFLAKFKSKFCSKFWRIFMINRPPEFTEASDLFLFETHYVIEKKNLCKHHFSEALGYNFEIKQIKTSSA